MPQIVLDDPALDARHPFTRVFLCAEYWRNKYMTLKGTLHMREHDLKCWPVYYDEIASGRLPFSIRNNLGRGFQKGDYVVLREFDPQPDPVTPKGYTGRTLRLQITYVESSWGVTPGHVVLGFGKPV